MIIEEKADKKNVIVAVAALIIGLIVGVVVTMAFYKTKMTDLGNKNGANSGKPGSTFGLPEIKVPDTVTAISGKVDKVDGSTLTVNANFFGQEKKFSVKIGSGTKIVRRELASNPEPPKAGGPMPSPFKETDAKLFDIKSGTMISADAGENIKNKTSFEAKVVYIDVMNLPAMPESLKK